MGVAAGCQRDADGENGGGDDGDERLEEREMHLLSSFQLHDDGRKVITTITESGRCMLAGREHAVNEHMRRTLSHRFDASERAQIAAVIPLLERLAEGL